MLRRAAIFAAAALALLGAASGLASLPRPLATGRYARVSGDPGAGDVAQQVAALIDDAVPKAARITGATDLRPVQAVVYTDRGHFSTATGVPRDNPTVGLALFPSQTIYIDGSGVFASVRRVVPHEVGHVLIWRALGPEAGAVPRWFNEGLAEYIASPAPAYVDPAALAALRQGGTTSVSNLEEAFQDPRAVTAAYAESSSLVSFLVARKGEAVLPRLLRALRETGDFPRALRRTAGLSVDDLDQQWQHWVRRRWWLMLPDLNLMLWFVMVVLLIIAVIRVVRERRRRREELEV
jgi:hypothetical protein